MALIGPNGAGKTTLFNTFTGFLRPDNGEVWFRDRRVDRSAPHRVARLGLVRTFQSIRMFSGLTVYESVLAARYRSARRRSGGARGRAWGIRPLRMETDAVRGILDLMGLTTERDRRCTDLPLLTQRRVEVARAVACDPSMILLDEPSAGATVRESQELTGVIRALRDRGMTVLVIEHNVPFVMGVSEQIAVMNFGELVAVGNPEAIRTNEIVQEIYLGG